MGRAATDVTVVLVRAGAAVAAWPLAGSARPDLALVDHLARLVTAARQLGYEVRVRDGTGRLSPLLDLLGLAGAVPVGGPSVDAVGQAEGGEEPGVEEVVVPDDPVA